MAGRMPNFEINPLIAAPISNVVIATLEITRPQRVDQARGGMFSRVKPTHIPVDGVTPTRL